MTVFAYKLGEHTANCRDRAIAAGEDPEEARATEVFGPPGTRPPASDLF